MAGKTPKLKLEIQYATKDPHAPSRPEFRKWIRSALKQDAEMVLRVVDATEGRDLNRNFRGRDYATNVLTFVYDNIDHPPISGWRYRAMRTHYRKRGESAA